MALSETARRHVRIGLSDPVSGNELCDLIDADTTDTMTDRLNRVLEITLGQVAAANLKTVVEAATGTPTDTTRRRLLLAFGHNSGNEVYDEIVANVD